MVQGPHIKVMPPTTSGGQPAAPKETVKPKDSNLNPAPEATTVASGQGSFVSRPLFEDEAGVDLGLGDLTVAHVAIPKTSENIVSGSQQGGAPARRTSTLTALEAQRALGREGIQVGRKIPVQDPPSDWKVGVRENGGELFSAAERLLLHAPTHPVPVEVAGEYAFVSKEAIPAILEDLQGRGFISTDGKTLEITSKGEAVISSRLTEPDETAATFAGHARIFAANAAMLTGGMDAKAYAQTILDVVGRGTDEGRKVALIGVAATAASELVTRLEQGVNRPLLLPEVANHLRFSLRPDVRPEAEPYLTMLADAQIVSNHFSRLSEAASTEDLVALVSSPGTYSEAANRPLSAGTMKRLSMLSLRALADVDEANGPNAAQIASAVLSAVGGPENAKVRSLGQLSMVLSPTVAIHAAAHCGNADLKALTERLQMSKDATSDLLSMMSRPMLYEMGGNQARTVKRLSGMARQLGHELSEAEERVVAENVESVALHDGAYKSYIAQLVAEGIGDPHLRPTILLEAAGHFASRNAELALKDGEQPRAEANIRIMAMLANGATVGDLERAYFASHRLAEHASETMEQRELAKVIAASLRATLIAAAGRSPNSADRDEYLASLAEAYPQPGQELAALRQAMVGVGSIEEQAPMASTFAQANLEAFVSETGLLNLRDIITIQALELAKRKHRVDGGAPSDGDPTEVETSLEAKAQPVSKKAKVKKASKGEPLNADEASLASVFAALAAIKKDAHEVAPGFLPQMGTGTMFVFEQPKGVEGEPATTFSKEQVVSWLRKSRALDPETEILAVVSAPLTSWGLFVPYLNVDKERLAEVVAAVNPHSCQVVYLGSTVDVAQAKAVRQALLDRNLSVTSMVLTDEQAAEVFLEAADATEPELD